VSDEDIAQGRRGKSLRSPSQFPVLFFRADAAADRNDQVKMNCKEDSNPSSFIGIVEERDCKFKEVNKISQLCSEMIMIFENVRVVLSPLSGLRLMIVSMSFSDTTIL
jgi:hypothetical protein